MKPLEHAILADNKQLTYRTVLYLVSSVRLQTWEDFAREGSEIAEVVQGRALREENKFEANEG